jgi:carboxyl-terminal processing protease
MKALRRWVVTAPLLALCGCGDTGNSTTASASWKAGTFAPSTSLAGQCASPRTGTDPSTGRPYADTKGSIAAENNWLRAWTNELYLWYREVPDRDPALTSTTAAYFDILKTTATTASGNPKDKFHFTYSTPDWIALSQSGIEAGYGAQWVIVASRPPRSVLVAYTEPNSPATSAPANLARGAQVLTVDGVDLVNANDTASVDKINEGLFPSAAGGTHTFSILDFGATSPRAVTLVATNVTSTPVQNVETLRTSAGTVGYMLFNDHLATAEQLLVNAFNQLAAAKVTDLVLDLRYNGGGYLDLASEVAYMIAGPGPTAGKTFEKTTFNDKNTTRDPVTGQALTPVPFHTTSQGFSGPQGQALPTLNLARVAVLTSSGTCSASEAIINSLRGVGVQVIQIGSTTCGKPFGFYPEDNCGTTYFSIQFQGVNAQGFGDYSDGFSPTNTTSGTGAALPGCSVGDDLGHALGDPAEARLATALRYLASPGCPTASLGSTTSGAHEDGTVEGVIYKSPWRENRILRR